jgi:ketosteroid isomerase-like protein
MSQENVEIVGSSFNAWNEWDVDAVRRLYAEDAVVKTGVTEFGTDWGQWHQELDEFLEAGDDAVVVLGHLVAQGQSSGIPVEGNWAALVKLREGQIASTRFFLDQDEALEAAGLRE